MSVVEGFTYTELRNLPLDELLVVLEKVSRISKDRQKAMKK